MKCPYCGFPESKVIDSRPADDGMRIRRRRECLECAKRFTTYEVVETVPVVIVKKDKSREAFDPQKLLNGMLRACEKRPVPYATLEKAVSDIEQSITATMEREVTSLRVGELAMEKLKEIDEVAYVRFASVYRQFSDIDTFMQELTELLSKRTAKALDEAKKK
ncbi:MAG: transcriptional regulator NrdR [Oscillospiraceae bacterium]